MNLNKYNLKTRCRAIFVISLGIINNDVIDLDESFFTNLHEFARLKINEDKNKYLPIFSLILPFISSGFKKSFYESEKTISDLYNIVDEISSIDRYYKLLDTVDRPLIDIISNIAIEYNEYLESFDYNYTPSLFRQ